MNVFVKIFCRNGNLKDEYEFPCLLYKKILKEKSFVDDHYYIQFYSVEDGKLKLSFSSSKKIPEINPEKDKVFLFFELFWDKYDYILEEIFAEYKGALKSTRANCVKLFTTYGMLEIEAQRKLMKIFEKAFPGKVNSRIEAPMLEPICIDCWAITEARKIVKFVEGKGNENT